MGITLQQLGDRVGLTAQQIMKIEAGTYEINASLVRDIAAALEVSALIFFEGVDLALGDVA
jgi:transcriptional regulator with XRE-family HTH domain